MSKFTESFQRTKAMDDIAKSAFRRVAEIITEMRQEEGNQSPHSLVSRSEMKNHILSEKKGGNYDFIDNLVMRICEIDNETLKPHLRQSFTNFKALILSGVSLEGDCKEDRASSPSSELSDAETIRVYQNPVTKDGRK